MPDRESALGGVLRRPFAQQAAFFRGKLGKLVPTERWDDLDRAAHDKAFMVAGAQKADLLADLAAAVDRAIVEGKSLEAFRKDFDAAVERNDWHGWTGEDTKGGKAWRTRTIYRTNAMTSYAAGRLAQLQAVGYEYWVYRHGGSTDPRPEHLDWDGLVLRADDPAWAWLYPPSDWGCSCYVNGARSLRAARRLGGDPDKPRPANFGVIDPRTGTPIGVGKGWDYAPGASVSGLVAAGAEKVRHWDYAIGKAFLGELPAATRDAIGDAYRRLPSVADDLRRYARRILGDGGDDAIVQPVWTIGPVPTSTAEPLVDHLGIDASPYDFSINPAAIAHVRKGHGGVEAEARRGQKAVQVDDYAMLPQIVARGVWTAAGTSWRTNNPLVQVTLRIGNLEYEATFELRKGRKTLALSSFLIRVRREGE